jgi:TolA-binding protein
MLRRSPFLQVLPFLLTMAGATASHADANEASPPDHNSPPADPAGTPPAPSKGEAGQEEKPAGEKTPAATGEVHVTAGDHKAITSLQKLGVSLTERSDWDGAEIAFRQVLAAPEATPDELANALLGLARVYRRAGSLTKAASIYERYLKDYPTAEQVPDALLEVGRTHRALGAHQLALERFYNVLNSTLKLSTEGSEHYQTLAKTAQFEIAETHFQQGNFADANKYFSRLRLLDLAPADRARAQFKSAYALYLNHDMDGAATALRSYLEQWPQDEDVAEARYLLSISLRTMGRKQEALDTALVLLRSEKANGDAKRWSYWQRRTGNQLANDFFQAGDTINALAIYQGLAALSPDAAWRLPVTYQIALCYERMRLYDRANAAYQSIIDGANPAAKPAAGESGKAPGAELAELSRMSTWRLGQINWHEQTERQLSSIFATGVDPTAKPQPPASQSVAPNIDTSASSPPTIAPVNDHPGSSAKTSSSL